jgi:lysozyme
LKYNGKWTFWQHSDVGKVEGVDGFVDVNVFNGSYEDLLELTLK